MSIPDLLSDESIKSLALEKPGVLRDEIISIFPEATDLPWDELHAGDASAEHIAHIESLFLGDGHSRANKTAAKAAVRAICSTRPRREYPASMPRVVRRNGDICQWDTDKIEVAARMAFLSLGLRSHPAIDISNAVADRVQGQRLVGIEEIQDLVQEELMRQGHYKVAEHYITFRFQRCSLREAAAPVPDNQDALVLVSHPDGSTELWHPQTLDPLIDFASQGLDLNLSHDQILKEMSRSLAAEMHIDALWDTLIMNARSLMERDHDFARFAGRVLLARVYDEVLGWSPERNTQEELIDFHKRHFRQSLERAVAIERVNPQLLEYNTDKLAESFDPVKDLDFDYLGLSTLYDRYFLVDKSSDRPRRLECPQFFWMRVAMGLFIAEPSNREGFVADLFDLYTNRLFCSSTPTLFNSGTPHSQMSSCYLYKVDDSIESIMVRGIAENAFLSKWAGGLGGSWTSVRGTGSYIKGTNGESQGVVPFLKLHNDQLVAVNQGGKRRGSGCAYLETWHNDIQDFLQLRVTTGDDRRRTHDMNTANWIPDLFMKRMEARQHWTLFRSNETPDLHDLYGREFENRYLHYEQLAAEGKIYGRRIEAIDLWKQMLKMIFETGHPWITFKDPCNVRSPQDHAGVVHSSNLCTEITLNTSEDETAVCNLGSIVLDNHITKDGNLDHDKLRNTVTLAVRALDNVIDINFYPTEAARLANHRHRPIGLGVMGLQNTLSKMGISFASQKAVDFNDEFMEAIAYYAYSASSDLAAERGTYSSYAGSKWDRGLLPQDTLGLLEKERGVELDVPGGGKMDWNPVREKIRTQGMRNSNVLAIAPTATIANIMGTTPCIEPNYRNLFVKKNLGGDFIVLNRQMVRDLKELGLWDRQMLDDLKYFDGELADIERIPDEIKRRHLTAFSIPYEFVVDAAARRQKWIDQSQSVNLFLATPDMKTLSHMYRRAWHTGLKTTYYLRSLGASKIEGPTDRKKDLRGVVTAVSQQTYTTTERLACSLDAMRNGEECQACQ